MEPYRKKKKSEKHNENRPKVQVVAHSTDQFLQPDSENGQKQKSRDLIKSKKIENENEKRFHQCFLFLAGFFFDLV